MTGVTLTPREEHASDRRPSYNSKGKGKGKKTSSYSKGSYKGKSKRTKGGSSSSSPTAVHTSASTTRSIPKVWWSKGKYICNRGGYYRSSHYKGNAAPCYHRPSEEQQQQNASGSSTWSKNDDENEKNLGGFPFRRLFAPSAEDQFLALKSATLVDVIDSPGGKKLIPVSGAWDLCDGLSDMFNESVRIRSRPLMAQTPLERWGSLTDDKLKDLVAQVAQEPPASVTNVDAWRSREALCVSGPECSQFRPSVAKAFYSMCADSLSVQSLQVLDPCGGWGDRLLGALASDVVSRITVVDPNPLVHSGYTAMAMLEEKVTVRTVCAPFEFADVEEGFYDVVFTSPPFYDKENYWAPGSLGQAERFPGPRNTFLWQNHWLQNWYLPFLIKAAKSVRPGGILALYVCDTTSGTMCEETRRELLQSGFVESISLRVGRRRLLPILCFRKEEDMA